MATSSDPSRDVPARRPMGLAPVTSARAHLQCTGGPEKGQTFRVAPGVTTIGRDPSCEVTVTEAAVSRQHCRIEHRGDQWLLKNLSDNGTRLNRKPTDEAPLADGDEIRIGAKTRLRFYVESVSLAPSGRPQFRPRSAAEEEEEEEGAPAPAGEEQPSILRRRKGLFIGLGIYFSVIVVGAIVAWIALRGTRGTADRQIELLGLSEIREAIEGKLDAFRNDPEIQTNTAAGDLHLKQALDFYDRRAAESENLFGAVRNFQKALAYYGDRGYFGQPAVDRIYLDAVRELNDCIYREYRGAVLDEKNGDYARSAERYRRILDMVPEKDNRIVENVTRRLATLRKHLEKR